MYEMLIEFFIGRPGRLSALGRALFQVSAMILLAGLGGRIATTGISAIRAMAGAIPPDPSLATRCVWSRTRRTDFGRNDIGGPSSLGSSMSGRHATSCVSSPRPPETTKKPKQSAAMTARPSPTSSSTSPVKCTASTVVRR